MRAYLSPFFLVSLQLCSQPIPAQQSLGFARPIVQTARPSRHVSYSPDGRRIAVCTADQVEIRDSRTLALIHEIAPSYKRQTASAAPNLTAWSPDGKQIAIAGAGVEVRDASNGRLIRMLDEDMHQTQSLAFSPDGTRLASVRCQPCSPSTLRLWDLASGASLASRFPKLDSVQGIAFSGNHHLVVSYMLASHSAKGSVFALRMAIYDSENGRTLSDFPLQGQFASAPMLLTEDGGKVLIGTSEELQLWDLQTMRLVRRRTLPTLQTSSKALVSRANQVALVGTEGWKSVSPNTRMMYEPDPAKTAPLIIWDFMTDEVREFKGFPVSAWQSVAVKPDGLELVLAGDAGLCRVSLQSDERSYRLASGRAIHTEHGVALWGDLLAMLVLAGIPNASHLNPNERINLIAWDLRGNGIKTFKDFDKGSGLSLSAPENSFRVGADRKIRPRSLDGTLLTNGAIAPWRAKRPRFQGEQLVKRGDWIAGHVAVEAWEKVGDSEWESLAGGKIGLYNLKSKRYMEFPDKPGEPIEDIRLSQDGRFLAAGFKPSIRVIACPGPSPNGKPFPDGKSQLDRSLSSAVLVWDLQQRKQKFLWPNAMAEGVSMSISPDGRWLATAGPESINHPPHSLQLWSLESGVKIGSWPKAGWRVRTFFDTTSEHLVSSSMHDGFKIIRLKDLAVLKEWKDPEGSTDWVSLHEGGHALVSLNRRGHLRFWAIPDGRLLLTLQNLTAPGANRPDWFCYTPEGQFDGSDGVESQLRWDLDGFMFTGEEWAKQNRVKGLIRNVLKLDQ